MERLGGLSWNHFSNPGQRFALEPSQQTEMKTFKILVASDFWKEVLVVLAVMINHRHCGASIPREMFENLL